MSFNYETWLTENNSAAISGSRRAIAAWRRIQRDPASVTIVREDGTTLDAQTVRVVPENSRSNTEDNENIVSSATISVTLFGVRNHPTTDDTDVKRGDLFRHLGDLYRVVSVRQYPGQVQAACELEQ